MSCLGDSPSAKAARAALLRAVAPSSSASWSPPAVPGLGFLASGPVGDLSIIPGLVAAASGVAVRVAAAQDAIHADAAEARRVIESHASCSDADALLAAVDHAETTKAVALDKELVAIDAALEEAGTACDVARRAAVELPDDALVAAYDGLSASLAAAATRLAALPPGPVADLTLLAIPLPPTVAVLDSSAGAADLALVPLPRFVTPGTELTLRLKLTDAALERLGGPGSALAAAALQAVVSRVQVVASFVVDGAEYSAAPASIAVAHNPACLAASLALPAAATAVSVATVSVGGEPVASPLLPASVRISRVVGVDAPATLHAEGMPTTTPFVSAMGDVFVPVGDSVLRVRGSSDGGEATRALRWPSASLGFPSNRVYAGAFDDATSTLFFSDWAGASSALAAFPYTCDGSDVESGVVPSARWRSPQGAFNECDSIVLLGGGRVAASSRMDKCVHVHDVESGARLVTAQLPCRPRNLAFDPLSGLLFVATPSFPSGGAAVQVLRWDGERLRCGPGGEGREKVAVAGDAAGAGVAAVSSLEPPVLAIPSSSLPLVAVARDTAAGGGSQLLVCSWGSSEARVYALPSCERSGAVVDLAAECGLSIERGRLQGLCADALGEGLVCVTGNAVQTAQWRSPPLAA